MTEEKILIENGYTVESFREVVSAFQKSRIILTAYELGIFSVVDEMGASAKTVAKRIKANIGATERLMNALCALGLLKKEGGIFFNTDFSKKYLVKGSSDYIAGLMHISALWDRWSKLTAVIKKGHPVVEKNKREKKWIKAFIAAMHDRAKLHAPALIKLLDISKVRKMLDLGGGSGAYAMAFVRAKPEISATIFDLPDVISLTKKYIKNEGFIKKISLIGGDYLKDNIGKGYDLILLSQIIHSNSPSENKLLIKKCSKALNSGGQIVIQDFIIDEDRTKPLQAALFSINMLVGTRNGNTYTENEVADWLLQSDFTYINRKDTSWKTTIIIGFKK